MQPFVPEQLPPIGLDLVTLFPLAGKANRAIATLDGLFYGIPNPDVLLTPITSEEAVLSSKIEGTQAGLEDLLKFDAGALPSEASLQADVQEIQNYRAAMEHSRELLKEKPFCLNSLLKLHEILMDSVRGHNKARGRFRSIQNWIGSVGCTMEQASFVPPAPESLLDHLSRWEAYWHGDAPDPLIQLAIIHAQFEIIHPFIDGNGRLGRMVIPLFLYEKKILSHPCFYLSAYFESHRDEYLDHLRNISRSGDWTAWCAFFLEGVAQQASTNTKKARDIQDLYEHLKTRFLDLTHSQYAVPLLDYIFVHPIFRASDLSKLENMPTNPMVSTLLKQIKEGGLLHTVVEGAGRRSHIYALAELINLCEGKKVY